MGRLSVEFELEIKDAQQKGYQAGKIFANSFREAANKILATAVPADLIKNLADLIKNLSQVGWQAPQAPSYKGPIPPKLQDIMNQRIKTGLLGLGAAPFSSFIGARLLSDAAFGGKRGGGGHDGLLGAGGAGGFAEFFIGIEALKKAFEYGAEKIKEVVEKGFQLYVRAGQLQRGVGELFAIQAAGEQVGLNQSQIDQFLLRNQWGKARTSLQNFGVFTQIGGMSKDFKEAYQWASEIAPIWDRTARTTFEIHNNIYRMKEDWLAMWTDSRFLEGLNKTSSTIDKLLHYANKNGINLMDIINGFNPDWSWLNLVGKGGNGTSGPIPAAPDFPLKQTLPQMGAWEKMGFVIGTSKMDKQDRIIGQLDMAISIWKQILQKISTGHSLPAYVGTSNQNLNPP